MKLYLVQHGAAMSEAENPARPLAAAGRADVEKVGRCLARVPLVAKRPAVRHSGKLRAAQTAELLCAGLGWPAPEVLAGLAPNDPPETTQEFVSSSRDDLVLVGHLPHLARLAALLLRTPAPPVRFRMGGVVCLDRDQTGNWALEWMLIPDLLV